MCIGILRDPAKEILAAARSRKAGKSYIVLIESAILFGLAVAILLARSGFLPLEILAGVAVTSLLIVIVFALVFGLVIEVAARTLGGKGHYFEGLTSIAYGLVPISAGIFITSLLALIPFVGLIIGGLVLAVTFALGVATLYRAIKELFHVDMITSFVVVSIVTISLLVAVYGVLGLNLLTNLGRFVPGF